MTKANGRPWGTDLPEEKIASAISLDPVLNLAASVCAQAVKDFYAPDPVLAVDALTWWLGDAAIWLEALELIPDPDPDRVFTLLLSGGGK